MRALTCLLTFAVAAMLVAGCEPTKSDTLPPAGTEVKPAVYPEGQTPALEPLPVAVTPTAPVVTPTAPPKMKTPAEKTKTPPAEKTKTPPAEKTKTPPVKGEQYTVKKGDTLSSIAKKFYNDATLWKKIADANKEKVHDKDKIYIGSVLVIPAK